jgi:hypothetical protein
MTVSLVELGIEKLREEELEEARAIQGVMLPTEPLRAGAVRIVVVLAMQRRRRIRRPIAGN